MAFSVVAFQNSGQVLEPLDLINVTDVWNVTSLYTPLPKRPLYELSLSLTINGTDTGGSETPEKYLIEVLPSPEQLRTMLEIINESEPTKGSEKITESRLLHEFWQI